MSKLTATSFTMLQSVKHYMAKVLASCCLAKREKWPMLKATIAYL
jgi:hypothetical protein